MLKKILFFPLLIIIMRSDIKADIAADIHAMTDGGRVKVVWARATDGVGWGNISQPIQSRNCVLMGYDSETGEESIIDDSLHNIIRPLISHNGSKVIWSSGDTGSVYSINWDGSGKKKLTDGIAGALWYDANNDREYVLYAQSCILYRSYIDTAYAIYRLNIDSTDDFQKLLDPETHDYRRIQPHFMGTSSDNRRVAFLAGWPRSRLYDWKNAQVVREGGGCWTTMPYDASYRLCFFESDHLGINVKTGPESLHTMWICPEDGSGGHVNCGIDHPRMSSWHPRYFCYVNEEGDGEEVTGPGNVHIGKANAALTTVEYDIEITQDADGWPDMWIQEGTDARSITLTTPVEGDVWHADSEHTVSWSFSGEIPQVMLAISADNGLSFFPLKNDTNIGYMNISLPVEYSASQVRILVRDQAEASIADTSARVTVVSHNRLLQITHPVEGARWRAGATYSVTWESTGNFDSVAVFFSPDSGASWTMQGAEAAGKAHSFSAPSMHSPTCLFRIHALDDSTIADTSGQFSIFDTTRTMSILAPDENSIWVWNSTHTIRWNTGDVLEDIMLSLSIDSGITWLASVRTENNGLYDLAIKKPFTIVSDKCFLRITAPWLEKPVYSERFSIDSIAPTRAAGHIERQTPLAAISIRFLQSDRIILQCLHQECAPVYIGIYSPNGKLLTSRSLYSESSKEHTFSLVNLLHNRELSPGIYIVRAAAESISIEKKIAVH